MIKFGPRNIRTPDLNKDIRQFFCSEMSDSEFTQAIDTIDSSLQGKLRRITERMEFVHHLLMFRDELKKNKTIDFSFFKEPGVLLGISKIDHIRMFDKNFDGVDYDIEALVLYLLLTCIDTIAGQDEYKPFCEWLNSLRNEFNNAEINIDWINQKEREHKEIYGIGKNFKSLIINDLSDELKLRAIKNFAVAKLDDGKVNPESWDSWKSATNEQKISKIAKNLFEQIRNKYTHSSHRTFIPCVNVKYLMRTDNPVLIALVDEDKETDSLIRLLIDIVTYSVRTKLIKK